jgi:hypothetical protein
MLKSNNKFSPLKVKSRAEEFSQANKVRKVLPEIPYQGKTAYIKELNLAVKIKQGNSLKSWIIKYVSANPVVKEKLYKAYGVTEKDIKKYQTLSPYTNDKMPK